MNEHTTCPIWGTLATEFPSDRDGRDIDSLRAGGKYFITGTAVRVLENYDERIKAKLTTWLVEHRRLGEICPEISEMTIREAQQRKDIGVFERADNVLRYLATKSRNLGARVVFRSHKADGYWPGEIDELDNVYFELLAHSGCTGLEEFEFLLAYLEERRFIERLYINNPEQGCILTVAGHARLAELETTLTPSSRAFVAMWFDDSIVEAYENGIAPAVRDTGYEPVRIDLKEHVNKIDDEIIAEIRRARFIIADFTHGDTGVRGGVYYEAGFAHGLGIPVIFSCRKDRLEDVHFDTRQYNYIVWETVEELGERMAKRIAAVIGDGPNKPPS